MSSNQNRSSFHTTKRGTATMLPIFVLIHAIAYHLPTSVASQSPSWKNDKRPPVQPTKWENSDTGTPRSLSSDYYSSNVGEDLEYFQQQQQQDDDGDNNMSMPPSTTQHEDYNNSALQHGQTIPPPPPPRFGAAASSSSTSIRQQQYNPIHYNFDSLAATARQKHQAEKRGFFGKRNTPKHVPEATLLLENDDDDVPIPFESLERQLEQQEQQQPTFDNSNTVTRYASPRRDAITLQMQTTRGRLTLWASCGIVGAMLGTIIGRSMLLFAKQSQFWASVGAMLFAVVFLLRNPYGELVRALGLTLLWAIQRSHAVRKRYPTGVHLKAIIGAGPRRAFPPGTNNPWTYQSQQDDDEDDRDDIYNRDNGRPLPRSASRRKMPQVQFNMLYSMIAMGFVGSACGGNMPVIPTWLGALMGAAVFAYSTTLINARGDLSRTMGMRVVAIGQLVLQINRELRLLRKTAVVSGLILDKILILDRKHRIKERIVSGANFLYDQASRTAQQVQQQQQQQQQSWRRGNDDTIYDGRGEDERRRRGGLGRNRERGSERRRFDGGRDDHEDVDEFDNLERRSRGPPRNESADVRGRSSFDSNDDKETVDDFEFRKRELWQETEDNPVSSDRFDDNDNDKQQSSRWWKRR